MDTRTVVLRAGFLIVFAGALLVAIALPTVLPSGDTTTDAPGADEPDGADVNQTTTPSGVGGSDGGTYGLLPTWEAAYDGKCTDCHTGAGSRHKTPYHPLGVDMKQDASTMFYDDNVQLGPNLQVDEFQQSSLAIGNQRVNCEDCHTPSNADELANPDESGATGDVHSVHDNVVKRESCARCHETIEEKQRIRCDDCHEFATVEESPEPLPDPHVDHEFVTETEGCGSCHKAMFSEDELLVKSPINMVRGLDERLLATQTEAAYSGISGDTNGYGWAKYEHPESSGIVSGGCGDCHGSFHEQEIQFTFEGHGSVGPIIEAAGGTGISLDDTSTTCGGNCHSSNIHAVHTNGNMSARNPADADLTGIKGAESCSECHGKAIAKENGGHFTREGSKALGLRGEYDVGPDAPGYEVPDGDCGFCHEDQALQN